MEGKSRNAAARDEADPISKVFSFVGFGIAMVLMLAFVPASENHTVNFIVGAVFGGLGGGFGGWFGSLLDA